MIKPRKDGDKKTDLNLWQVHLLENLRMAKKLTEQQVRIVLDEYKLTNQPLPQILQQKGFLSEEEVHSFLSRQLGVTYVDLEQDAVDANLLKEIPAEFARQYKCFPWRRHQHKLTVLIANPYNILAMDALRTLLKERSNIAELDFVCGSERKLLALISTYYAADKLLDTIQNKIQAAIGQSLAKLDGLMEIEETSQPLRQLVHQLLELGIEWHASDIHLCPEEKHVQTRYRIDGMLLPGPSLPKKLQHALCACVKLLARLDIAEHRVPQEGKILFYKDAVAVDLRLSSLPVVHGENLVIRVLDRNRLLDMENLGLSASLLSALSQVLARVYGLFLVCGPTGSGKSTTLYACLRRMNALEKNIVTLEDPIEYELPFVRQSQIDAAANHTFVNGLKFILRHDPDVIMVGEIRDAETTTMAIQAAQTGHLVLSTVHANSAMGAVARMVHLGVDLFSLSAVLEAVLAQRLVRKICIHCKESYPAPTAEKKSLRLPDDSKLWRGKGCPLCMTTGYRGRTGLFEFLLANEQIKAMIVERKSEHLWRQASDAETLRSFADDARDKITNGITSFAEVMRVFPEALR